MKSRLCEQGLWLQIGTTIVEAVAPKTSCGQRNYGVEESGKESRGLV